MHYSWLFIPLLSLLAGWLCTRLLAWNLFYPVREKRVFGLKMQGLLPRNRSEIIMALATEAEHFFISYRAQLATQLADPARVNDVLPVIEAHVDNFLRNKLKEQIPMIGMLIGDKTIAQLKTIFMKEIEEMFPVVIGQYATNLAEGTNISDRVRQQLDKIPASQWIERLRRPVAVHFNRLYRWGALAGLLTGLLQLAVLWLLH